MYDLSRPCSKHTVWTPCQFTRVLTDTLREQRQTDVHFVLSGSFCHHTIHHRQQQWHGIFSSRALDERRTGAYGPMCHLHTRREHAVLLSSLENKLGKKHSRYPNREGSVRTSLPPIKKEPNVCREKGYDPSMATPYSGSHIHWPVQRVWWKMENLTCMCKCLDRKRTFFY